MPQLQLFNAACYKYCVVDGCNEYWTWSETTSCEGKQMSPNDIEEMKLAAATQTEMTELQDRLGSGYIPQGCKS